MKSNLNMTLTFQFNEDNTRIVEIQTESGAIIMQAIKNLFPTTSDLLSDEDSMDLFLETLAAEPDVAYDIVEQAIELHKKGGD